MELNDLIRDTWQTSLIFVSLVVFTRILGNTQLGQLTFCEYVTGITIGSIAGSIASAEPGKFLSHYYDLALFVLLTYLLSLVTIKSRPLRKLIEGSPRMIIDNGLINKKHMKEMRYDLDELNSQLREKGILDISEVQYATIEPTGQLSIILKPDFQPLTKSDMNIHLPNPTFPVELIMDGQVIQENLDKKNLTADWLQTQLTKRNIKSPTNVMYAVIDSNGQLFISSKGSKY